MMPIALPVPKSYVECPEKNELFMLTRCRRKFCKYLDDLDLHFKVLTYD